jgi:3-deoxy-D-manno-octulosonate 8-phosphate phosphatase KdsC-like HAD superfamily phosphatase
MNNIKAFVFDVDGVLTDGTVHVSQDGQLLRQMNIRDGYAQTRSFGGTRNLGSDASRS